MKKVSFKQAIGQALAHDICEIKGQTIKRAAFKRGHIINVDDEAYLRELGKQHFYVLEDGDEHLIHEEDAATIMFDLFNNGDFYPSPISMGKISFHAKKDGYFSVNKQALIELNMLGDISAACIDDLTYVKAGSEVASMRIIPLFTDEQKIASIKALPLNFPLFTIKPVCIEKVALITTGSEVANGLIADGFKPKLDTKLANYCVQISNYQVITDDIRQITKAIENVQQTAPDLILVSGGMSVDPDDLTPGAIKASGANIITYGTPIIPGSMFLYGYLDTATIIGLPGAVIFEEKTAFDLLLPYALTKTPISNREIMEMAIGGLLNAKL